MYSSNYSSALKKDYPNDNTYLRTSQKLRYPGQSQSFNQTPVKSLYKSETRNSSGRVESARRDINQLIEMVSDKKRMNQEAIEEVRMVNQEIAEGLGRGYPQLKSNTYDNRNRTAESSRRQNPTDYGYTSQFQWRSTEPENRNRYYDQPEFQNDVQLRQRLNQEIKKNNQMLRYISSLEAQNSSLRSSRHSPNLNDLIQQNQTLKNRLANLRPQSKIPYDLIEELQALKQENDNLRKETVALIRAKQSS